jgi:uncharacterized protein (DUF1330 family)
MSGYAIFNINITNSEAYKEYVSKIVDIIKKFDGKYLVRGGECKVMEGEWKHSRTIVIKFLTYQRVLEWYNSEE